VAPLSPNWLQNACDANSDGTGVIVRSKDGILQVQKSFADKEFIDYASSFGEDYDVIAHARIGTSGGRNIENLHPFPIYRNSQAIGVPGEEPVAYLMHNGIVTVPEWDEKMSDTWHLARIWEASYGGEINAKMRQRGWRRRQKKRLGSYSKFVLVDKEGVSIINPKGGFWKDGVWFSNNSALQSYYSYASTSPLARVGSPYGDLEDEHEYVPVKKDGKTVGYKREWNPDYSNTKSLDGEEYLDEDSDSAVETAVNELRREHIIAQWAKDSRVGSIEETIFEYSSEDVAGAIRELLRQNGSCSRLGGSE
jgi:hypothetical protein